MRVPSPVIRLLAALGWSFPAADDPAAQRRHPASFNLRLWFGIAGFVVIAAMGTLFAVMLTGFISNQMLRREVVVTRDFLESIIWAEESGRSVFRSDTTEANPHLASFVQHIRTMPDVLRANIYAAGGLIVWSTDPSIIGRRFAINPGLDRAFRGELVTEIGTLESQGKAEHVNLRTADPDIFIEAYMPIRTRTGVVLGVIELYKVPNALNATIREGQRMVWISVGIGMLMLYLSLFWIVRRGAHLIQRQQAELGHMAALAALGQMASAIAHSLRNPLSGIRTSAEMLQHEPAAAAQTAGDIIGEVDRLDSYVRELLAYARSDGQAAQVVDPAEVLRDTLSRLEAALTRSAIDVTVNDIRLQAERVVADPQLLGQAFGNVVTNAIEAMGPGGRLAVTIAQAGGVVAITISDTGPGIPNAIRCQVAEPFFTTKTRGLGLGLALSRQIVERFAGRLDIVPATTAGAAIRISLPALRPGSDRLA